MPEVQNIGAVDYAQYQPSQSQYEEYADNYNMAPEIYDEGAAEARAASKSHLGATILSSAIVGGLALWGGHALGKRSASKQIDKLEDAAKKYKEFLENNAKELEKEADEVRNANIFSWKKGGKFAEKVKEEFAKLRKSLEDVKDEAKESGEKAADDAKKSADDAK